MTARTLADYPEVMTLGETAEYLRRSESTIRRQFVAGNLPGFQIERSWFVHRDHVDRFVRGRVPETREGITT